MVNHELKKADFKFGLSQENVVLTKIRKYFKDENIKKNPDTYAPIDFMSFRKDGTLKYKIEVKSRKQPYFMDYNTLKAQKLYSNGNTYELRSLIFGNNKMEEYEKILLKNPKCKCYVLFNMYDKTFKKQNIFYYRITLDRIRNKENEEWIKEPNVWNKARDDPEKNTNIGIYTKFLKPLDKLIIKTIKKDTNKQNTLITDFYKQKNQNNKWFLKQIKDYTFNNSKYFILDNKKYLKTEYEGLNKYKYRISNLKKIKNFTASGKGLSTKSLKEWLDINYINYKPKDPYYDLVNKLITAF